MKLTEAEHLQLAGLMVKANTVGDGQGRRSQFQLEQLFAGAAGLTVPEARGYLQAASAANNREGLLGLGAKLSLA